MGGVETYLIQKNFKPEAPRSPVGQNVNIIHMSMLYWPEPTPPLVLTRNRSGAAHGPETLPPVKVGERPHGEEQRMNPGMKVTAI